MEITDVNEFIKEHLVETKLTSPGLYIYLRKDQEASEYPHVDLVEVRFMNGMLIGDSDNWFTWMLIPDVEYEIPGTWSKKISFI